MEKLAGNGFIETPEKSPKRLGQCQFLVWAILMGVVLALSVQLAVAGDRMSIKSKIANVRSGPGSGNDVLWQLERYHPLVILEKKGNWYRFEDFESDTAWIHKSLLDKTPSVVSVKSGCNVRSGPGTGNDVVFTVDKGVPFKVLSRKGKWIKIEHADGDQGWIFKTLVW